MHLAVPDLFVFAVQILRPPIEKETFLPGSLALSNDRRRVAETLTFSDLRLGRAATSLVDALCTSCDRGVEVDDPKSSLLSPP